MIRVARPPAPKEIPLFSRKWSKWNGETIAEHELREAIAFCTDRARYGGGQKPKKGFKFDAYKNKQLRTRLEKAFHNKCAYCEVNLAAGSYLHVEHFRPKSEVDTGGNTLAPGYYWLACEWENLLLACAKCNSGYKGTKFPLRDGRYRTRTHRRTIDGEEPHRLLLNPCIDDPALHLLFAKDGTVKPRRKEGTGPSDMGETSIATYGLHRKDLADERAAVALRVDSLVADLEEFTEDLAAAKAANNAARVTKKQASLQRKMDELGALLVPEAEYLAVTRHRLRVLNRAGRFRDLRGYGFDPMDMVRESERLTGTITAPAGDANE